MGVLAIYNRRRNRGWGGGGLGAEASQNFTMDTCIYIANSTSKCALALGALDLVPSRNYACACAGGV